MPEIKNSKKFICVLLTAIFLSGCSPFPEKQQEALPPEQPAITHDDSILQQIDYKQKLFLLLFENSYYPVEVLSGNYIETFPVQISVHFFQQKRMLAVPVTILFIPGEIMQKKIIVQYFEQDKWQPVPEVATSSDDFARILEQVMEKYGKGKVRIQLKEKEK